MRNEKQPGHPAQDASEGYLEITGGLKMERTSLESSIEMVWIVFKSH